MVAKRDGGYVIVWGISSWSGGDGGWKVGCAVAVVVKETIIAVARKRSLTAAIVADIFSAVFFFRLC